MTTVNDFVDILRIIREQPEWGDALRSALLSKELLELPQTLAKFAESANKRFDRLEEGQTRLEERQTRLEESQTRLEESQTRLEERQARLERSFTRMEGDVGNLKGDAYELKVGNNIFSLIGQHSDIIPVRVLKGSRAPNDMAFLNPIYEAKRKGIITEQERLDAFAVDIVLEGRREAEDATLLVVVEVSTTIADSDINRASERAGIVQKATGTQALPAVVGTYADQVRRQLAQERNVTLISYGQ